MAKTKTKTGGALVTQIGEQFGAALQTAQNRSLFDKDSLTGLFVGLDDQGIHPKVCGFQTLDGAQLPLQPEEVEGAVDTQHLHPAMRALLDSLGLTSRAQSEQNIAQFVDKLREAQVVINDTSAAEAEHCERADALERELNALKSRHRGVIMDGEIPAHFNRTSQDLFLMDTAVLLLDATLVPQDQAVPLGAIGSSKWLQATQRLSCRSVSLPLQKFEDGMKVLLKDFKMAPVHEVTGSSKVLHRNYGYRETTLSPAGLGVYELNGTGKGVKGIEPFIPSAMAPQGEFTPLHFLADRESALSYGKARKVNLRGGGTRRLYPTMLPMFNLVHPSRKRQPSKEGIATMVKELSRSLKGREIYLCGGGVPSGFHGDVAGLSEVKLGWRVSPMEFRTGTPMSRAYLTRFGGPHYDQLAMRQLSHKVVEDTLRRFL
jgi:hypothetical protein